MNYYADRKFEMPWGEIVTCSVKVPQPFNTHTIYFPPRFEKTAKAEGK